MACGTRLDSCCDNSRELILVGPLRLPSKQPVLYLRCALGISLCHILE